LKSKSNVPESEVTSQKNIVAERQPSIRPKRRLQNSLHGRPYADLE
jgi:hypothetical protein